MAYVVEAVSDEDWQRILADWEADLDKKDWLKARRSRNMEPSKIKFWVIDRESDSYLLYGPTIAPGPETGQNYSFFYKKKLYWIGLFKQRIPDDSVWGGGLVFTRPASIRHLPTEEQAGLRVAIKTAFSIHTPSANLSITDVYKIVFLDEECQA